MDHIFAFSMLNSTPAGKKYTTTGSVTVTNISYATAMLPLSTKSCLK